MYFVYVLRSLKARKTYVGVTQKLPDQRLAQHNIGSNAWTRSHKPFELVYYESYHCKEDAWRREKYLKSGIGNKLVSLIRDHFDQRYVRAGRYGESVTFHPQGDRPVGETL